MRVTHSFPITDYYTKDEVNSLLEGNITSISGINGIIATYQDDLWYVGGQDLINRIITTSGDIIAQVGESGVTLEQLTTTSGDIIGQMPILVGQGGVTTNLVGLTWYIDGSTISGGEGSLPAGTLSALLVYDGSDWLATTSGSPSVNSIKFTDGSEATTARSVTQCSGTEITQIFDIYYSDTFPKTLFTLPANCEITNVDITVVSGFLGGYGSEMYPSLSLLTGTTSALSTRTCFRRGSEYLRNGFYACYIGVNCTNSAVIKPKYGRVWSRGASIDCRDSLSVTVSGGSVSFTSPGGEYWQACDPFRIPDIGEYEIGSYSAVSLTAYGCSSANTNYGLQQSYKTGSDQTGSQIVSWGTDNYCPRISVRYAVSYKIGEELDNESIIKEFTPSVHTSVSGLQQGNTWYPTPADRLIKIYRTQSEADTSGHMQVTVKYREQCFDVAQHTVISGAENVYVEESGYNKFLVSATTPCYQSLCQRTIQASISGSSFPIRFSLFPSNHLLQSMSLTLSGVAGGAGTTAGTSFPLAGGSQSTGYTIVGRDFTLVNQAQISSVWLFNKTAGATFTVKQAREITAGTYILSNIYSGTHDGNGEQQFDFTPVTITGVESDVMYAAVYWATGTTFTHGTATNTPYMKTGNLTGYVGSFGTASVSYNPIIRVGYVPTLSVGVPVDHFRFISNFTSASGTVTSSGNLGPYSEVVPIEIYSASTNITDPTSGVFNLTYNYYCQDNIKYNRGYGLTWLGTGGTQIIHNFGNLNHTIYITPNDANPGNWWVTKGINTDTVYSDTLSGTGSFDWFIQL